MSYTYKRKNKRKNKKSDISTEELIQKTKNYAGWIQEFSKKIVAIAFIIFLIINVFVLIIIGTQYFQMGELASLDTLIAEANLTFREVIGGYIIKAAAENAIKISGGVLEKYLTMKFGNNYEVSDNIDDDPSSSMSDFENQSNNDPEVFNDEYMEVETNNSNTNDGMIFFNLNDDSEFTS